MRFCIFEAMLIKDRAFLDDDKVSIGIGRDERAGKLMLHITSVNDNLDRRSFMIWQKRVAQGNAINITKATVESYTSLWTPKLGAPPRADGTKVEPDPPDLEKVKRMVRQTEVLKPDSAANEILSGSMMKNGESVLIGGQKVQFKNMIIGRDKAHGSRRTADLQKTKH